MSLNTNTIPDAWKASTTIMLPKSGKKELAIYRPIALISPIANVLERLVLKRLEAHTQSPLHQHGFEKMHIPPPPPSLKQQTTLGVDNSKFSGIIHHVELCMKFSQSEQLKVEIEQTMQQMDQVEQHVENLNEVIGEEVAHFDFVENRKHEEDAQ